MDGVISGLLIFAVALFVLALFSNLLRTKVQEPPELVPNCLMTKSPVEFWTGPRSLFYFMAYWNDLPLFLQAHGYEVRQRRLPWRDPVARRAWAAAQLHRGVGHLVIDQVTSTEFSDLLKEKPPLSVTVMSSDEPIHGLLAVCFWLHRQMISWTRPQLPQPTAGSLGLSSKNATFLKHTLLHEIRNQAESEWVAAN